MKRRIKDILKEAGLIKPNGYMTYYVEENGIRNVSRMYVSECWEIEDYSHTYTSSLYKGERIGICRCLTPLEMQRDGIVEETKKSVFLSVLQGILTNHKLPMEDRVHLWTEEREGFTYIYGAIKV